MATFRVATFNVENLNREGVFFAGREKDDAYDAELLNEKTNWIAGMLDSSRADVCAVQEVFSFEALLSAAAKSKYKRHRAPLTVLAPLTENRTNEVNLDNGRIEAKGPYVGLISRFPVLTCDSVAFFPIGPSDANLRDLRGTDESDVAPMIVKFERPILRAKVVLPGAITATFLVAHLKSKRPMFSFGEDKEDPTVQALALARSLVTRTMEAVALRAMVISITKELSPSEPLILLGDFNDTSCATTLDILTGIQVEEAKCNFSKQDGNSSKLYNVFDVLKRKSTGGGDLGTTFASRHEILDHIFITRHFVKEVPERLAKVRSVQIFGQSMLDQRWPPDGANNMSGLRPPSVFSDHGILVAEFSTIESGYQKWKP